MNNVQEGDRLDQHRRQVVFHGRAAGFMFALTRSKRSSFDALPLGRRPR